MQEGWIPLVHGDRLRLRGARYEHYYRFFSHALTPEEYVDLQPEGPTGPHGEAEFAAAEAEAESPPEGELIIEIPMGGEGEGEFSEEYAEEEYAQEEYAPEEDAGEAYAEEGMDVPETQVHTEVEPHEEESPAMATHGFQDEEPEFEGEEDEGEGEDGGEPSPLAELETIFSDAPAAPAKEEGQEDLSDQQRLSFTDIFGEEEVIAAAAAQEDAEAPDEEEDESAYEDQETIFEQFFGKDESADAEEEKDGTDIIDETVSQTGEGTNIMDDTLSGGGDGTEIVDEGMLSDAFDMDPEGVFSDGDITKLLEEEGLIEEGDNIVIDVPADMEGIFGDDDDTFSVGSGEEALEDAGRRGGEPLRLRHGRGRWRSHGRGHRGGNGDGRGIRRRRVRCRTHRNGGGG
jgi:hypothetical protein